MKIFLGILSSCILSGWPNQLILCPFIHFTIFSHLLISSSSRFVRLFHSPFSYLGPYILLNIFIHNRFVKYNIACYMCRRDVSFNKFVVYINYCWCVLHTVTTADKKAAASCNFLTVVSLIRPADFAHHHHHPSRFGLYRPVSVSSNSLLKGLPSHLRPFGL